MVVGLGETAEDERVLEGRETKRGFLKLITSCQAGWLTVIRFPCGDKAMSHSDASRNKGGDAL